MTSLVPGSALTFFNRRTEHRLFMKRNPDSWGLLWEISQVKNETKGRDEPSLNASVSFSLNAPLRCRVLAERSV